MIDWSKPVKVRSTEEHNEKFSSDGGVPGTFVPNMTKEDMMKWKGNVIGMKTDSPRCELRKTFSRAGSYAQMLVVMYWKDEYVTISSNGKIVMTFDEMIEFNSILKEGFEKLKEVANDHKCDKE